MGCDGGTIPKRHELVKTAKRGEQKDKDMDRKAKWSLCTISQETLTAPVMICELGRLYSKESILEYILDQTAHDNCSHIVNMKNVKELKLTPNPGYGKNPSGCHDQYFDTQLAKYVCPVVGLEMNGKYKFCALWSCGCVLSERALKEVDSDSCHSCGSTFQKEDIIMIYPDDDDLALMEENMKARREKMKALRKENKLKKNKRKIGDSDSSTPLTSDVNEPSTSSQIISPKSKKVKDDHEFEAPKMLPPIKGNQTFEAPKKIPEVNHKFEVPKKLSKKGDGSKHEGSKKLSKGDGSKHEKSKKLSKNVSKDADADSSGSGSSSRLDPRQTNVYKKLFTSGADKKGSDSTPHWITYNPYHL